MHNSIKQLPNQLLLCALVLIACPAQALEMRALPMPPEISPELRPLVAAPGNVSSAYPQSPQEWKAMASDFAASMSKGLPELRQKLGVTMSETKINHVPVFVLTPTSMPASHKNVTLLHFHGGGYVFGGGESGTGEAVLMAAMGKFKVISVDYRMAPDFPYPAAMDDAMAVYRELLKSTPPQRIGVFGTSTGGGMTLVLSLRAKAEGLPQPGALSAGTPWTDLTRTGDSYFSNEGVDNILVSYDGWLGAAARLYAAGRDLKDPMLSPVYGEVRGFPPTLLVSGTRDLFLSNTVRMHVKLRQAGVNADLLVYEGQSHAQYYMVPAAPETLFHFTELTRFFDKHLRAPGQSSPR